VVRSRIDVHEFSALFRDPYAKDEDEAKALAASASADAKDKDGKRCRDLMESLSSTLPLMQTCVCVLSISISGKAVVRKFERLNLPPQFAAQYRREEEELKERKLKEEKAAREVARRKEMEEKLLRDAEEEKRKVAAAELARQEAERIKKLTAGGVALWACAVCSFVNQPNRKACAVCASPVSLVHFDYSQTGTDCFLFPHTAPGGRGAQRRD
jgi:hypothetical protein